MYGQDRLTQPLMRMKDGKFDKKGQFVPVTWEQAFDEMERQWRKTYAEKGPTGVAIIGSGQYTVQEGYAAVKLMKVGMRSNNLDPNARNCMASAVAAFMQTFGIDEPDGQLRRHRACRFHHSVGRQHGGMPPHPLVAHRRPASVQQERAGW